MKYDFLFRNESKNFPPRLLNFCVSASAKMVATLQLQSMIRIFYIR